MYAALGGDGHWSSRKALNTCCKNLVFLTISADAVEKECDGIPWLTIRTATITDSISPRTRDKPFQPALEASQAQLLAALTNFIRLIKVCLDSTSHLIISSCFRRSYSTDMSHVCIPGTPSSTIQDPVHLVIRPSWLTAHIAQI